jgi:16S rRNA (guanine966-N2)-methyltransferase
MSVKIIGGKFKGFPLKVPDSARPTLSRHRQSLFDMLESQSPGGNGFFKEKILMDCFAGSGAFGFEAISRGAGYVYFVDSDPKAISAIHYNNKKMKTDEFCSIRRSDVRLLKYCQMNWTPVDLAFLDPPYGKVSVSKTLEHLFEVRWISKKTIIITEESAEKSEFIEDKHSVLVSKTIGNTIFKIMLY